MKNSFKPLSRSSVGAVVAVLMMSAAVHADFVTDTIPAGTNPYAVAVNPVTNRTYVANYGSGTVTVIDGSISDTIATITVGSNPRAIAINALTNKIYVANFTGASVSIINGATNTVTATVPVQTMPNAIAANPSTNKVYVTNYGSASVSVINGSSDVIDTTIAVGPGPIAVCTNPVTNKIYVANSGGGSVTVINGSNNSTATVTVGTNPTSIAANTVTNKIYVANQGSSNVTVIDGATNGTSAITVGTSPSAIAINLVTDSVYVANSGSNSVTIIAGATGAASTITVGTNPVALAVNTTTNKIYVANYVSNSVSVITGAAVTCTLTVGTNPNALAVNTITNKIYIANYGSANVTIVDGAALTIQMGYGSVEMSPWAVAVNPVTNMIYMSDGSFGDTSILVMNGATNQRTTVKAGNGPRAIAVNPVTNKIYIANIFSNTVTVIDGATNDTVTVAAGTKPCAVAVNLVTNKIYVADSMSNDVTVIDGAANTAMQVAAGSWPCAVAVNPATNKIYVANFLSDNVTVIDGATNVTTAVSTGSRPCAVAVNHATNKIYVANILSNFVTIINGATNGTTTVAAGTYLRALAVNPVTNKIYVAGGPPWSPGIVTVIDGATNATVAVRADTVPCAIAVNSVTNRIFVECDRGETVIDGATNVVINPLKGGGGNLRAVAVNPVTGKYYVPFPYGGGFNVYYETPPISDTQFLQAVFDTLPNHVTYSSSPAMSGKAINRLRPGYSGISGILNRTNTIQPSLLPASIVSGTGTDSVGWNWTWGTDSLMIGENFLCAVALDSQAATANNTGMGTPFTGNMTVYPVYRLLQITPTSPPEAPLLVSPTNNAINQPTTVSFVWDSSKRASSYTLQVAADAGFTSLFYSGVFTSDTTQTATGLANGSTYYWRVCAYNTAGFSPWSSVWTFSTAPIIPNPPSTPVLSSPANGAIGQSTNPLLSWNSAARAASYTVQVSTDSTFATLTVNDSGITDTFHTVTGLSMFSFYYWRVRAVNAGGTSGWSTVWNFITGSTAISPTAISLPAAFSISGSSIVRYSLPIHCRVSLKYYDLRGRFMATLVNATQGAGYYTLSIKNVLPSRGTYIRVFEAGSFVKRELAAMIGK